MITRILQISFVSLASLQDVSGQSPATLFQSKAPLHIRANTKIKYIKKNLNDSSYTARKIYYEKTTGNWDSLTVGVQLHGHFRAENCQFPPTKLKLKKSDTKNTLFEGTKKLKLVVPCQKTRDKDQLIVREYLCYQFYQQISPFHFNTRLLSLDITDYSKKKPEKIPSLAFFIEDVEPIAERNNATEIKGATLVPSRFNAKQFVRNDLFQFMIGNIDWSAVYQHNIRVIKSGNDPLVAIPYDFDMSGFVNAAYAQSNRERVYRGFCRDEALVQEVRQEFLKLQSDFNATIDLQSEYFSSADKEDMKSYLKGFYDILKDDWQFKESIIEKCRTK
ncbi:MAG TPA: hypothetical protein VK589_02680 [Chryseolinea sp.]|nr:hypothetical protein [Chryseolinea sp.]